MNREYMELKPKVNDTFVDIIDLLIFFKKELKVKAYVNLNGVIYNNDDIKYLEKQKRDYELLSVKREYQEVYLNSGRISEYKEKCDKTLLYWIYKVKKVILPELEEEFEYLCYHYASFNKVYTIKYACYILYLYQTSENIEQEISKVMLEANEEFDYDLFKYMVVEYSNSPSYINKLLTNEMPILRKEEEVYKINVLNKKIYNRNNDN